MRGPEIYGLRRRKKEWLLLLTVMAEGLGDILNIAVSLINIMVRVRRRNVAEPRTNNKKPWS